MADKDSEIKRLTQENERLRSELADLKEKPTVPVAFIAASNLHTGGCLAPLFRMVLIVFVVGYLVSL